MTPLAMSRYATDDMPANTVYATQKTAVMSAPVRGSMPDDQLQQPAAAAELVRRDGRVRKDDGDGAEDPRRGAIAQLQNVGDGVLRDTADARSDEIDQRDAAHAPADCQSAANPTR